VTWQCPSAVVKRARAGKWRLVGESLGGPEGPGAGYKRALVRGDCGRVIAIVKSGEDEGEDDDDENQPRYQAEDDQMGGRRRKNDRKGNEHSSPRGGHGTTRIGVEGMPSRGENAVDVEK
jgi:hypothetical protein